NTWFARPPPPIVLCTAVRRTSSMSLPSSDRGISKYSLSPIWCVVNRPRFVTASGVITRAYGRGCLAAGRRGPAPESCPAPPACAAGRGAGCSPERRKQPVPANAAVSTTARDEEKRRRFMTTFRGKLTGKARRRGASPRHGPGQDGGQFRPPGRVLSSPRSHAAAARARAALLVQEPRGNVPCDGPRTPPHAPSAGARRRSRQGRARGRGAARRASARAGGHAGLERGVGLAAPAWPAHRPGKQGGR